MNQLGTLVLWLVVLCAAGSVQGASDDDQPQATTAATAAETEAEDDEEPDCD